MKVEDSKAGRYEGCPRKRIEDEASKGSQKAGKRAQMKQGNEDLQKVGEMNLGGNAGWRG